MADFPQPGQTVGRYTIGERLGQGGSGTVFRATRTMPRREVALKVIPNDVAGAPGFREHFLHEADLLSELNDPHIVSIHDVGEDDGYLFIATELVPGGDLGTRLLRGPVPLKPALTLTAQVSLALSAAHQAGIVHGDVKPTNVLLGQRDGMPHAYLCDFGIAQPAGAGGTRRNVAIGTVAYLAPELVTGGAPSAASDIYALGCLLVAAITGAPPYSGTDEEIAQQHVSSEIPHWEETSPLLAQLNDLVQVSMAKNPNDRYASAEEFRAAILGVLGDVPVVPPAPAPVAAPVPEPEPAPELAAPHEEMTPPEPAVSASPDPGADEAWPAAEQTSHYPPPAVDPLPSPEESLDVPEVHRWDEEEHAPRNGRVLISSLVALLLVAAAVGGIVLFQKDEDTKTPRTAGTAPTAPTTSPTGSPAPGQKKICQEGREVDANVRCGEPFGIAGLRYVFKTIPSGCTEKQLNTPTKYWEITCTGTDGSQVSYSTFRTTPIGREVNDALFPDSSPVTLPTGLLQYGPELNDSGTWQVGLVYEEKHPYGVLITADSSEAAQEIADTTAEGALAPELFVVE